MSVRYESRERCAILTLDRPEARNALTPAMVAQIESHLDRAEADDEVRGIVLAAASPVFCAGTDLNLVQGDGYEGIVTARGGYAGIVRRSRAKPLIAALDGPAYGGGTEIVLACDLVVASPEAGFALPEVKRGLVPSGGGLFNLARRVPRNIATCARLDGEPIGAEEAHRFGLVNELCAPGEAVAAALALAAPIAANGPVAIRESMALLRQATLAPDDEAWELSERAVQASVETEDAKEGVAAFLEKRPPEFRGR